MEKIIYEKRDRLLTAILACLLFVSPLLYVGVLRDPSDLPRYAALAFFVCLSYIVYVAYFFKGAVKISYTFVVLLALLYLLLAGFSGGWAVSPSTNLIYTIRLLCYVALFFIAVQIGSQRSIRIFLIASLLSAGITALIGLLQNHGYNIFGLRAHAMGGTFTFKNHMALYLDLVIPAGFTLLLLSKNRIQEYVFAACLSLCLLYIFNAHTRGSYLALGVACIMCLAGYAAIPAIRKNLKLHFFEKKWTLAAIFLVVAVVAQLPGKADWYEHRKKFSGDTVDMATRERLTAYNNVLSLIKENPVLGTGYGTFWKAYRPFTNHPLVSPRSNENLVFYRMHNDLLQIIVELGLTGGILCLAIIILSYKYGLRVLAVSQEPGKQLLLFGVLLSLSASLTHSMVDFPLIKPSSAEQIWLYLGLISGLYASHRSNTASIGTAWIKISTAVFAALLTISMGLYYRAYIIGSYYARKAEISLKNKNCGDSINYIEKSQKEFGHDFFVHRVRTYIQIDCNRNMSGLYDVLSQELAWDNTNIPALLKRGYILLASNWFDRAERDFKRVMYLLPNRASGFVGEAYVLTARGDYQQADKLLKRLQSRFPDNPDVKHAVERLRAEQLKKHQ